MADETMTVPRNGRLGAKLGEWAQTAVVVGTIIVSGIRWSTSVDNRLAAIESQTTGQYEMLRNAVDETKRHAAMASDAAERAEAAVARAETAVTQNQTQQKKVIDATTDNRKAIQTQTKRVTDLQLEVAKQLEAFSWRMRQLEDKNTKVLEKKGKED